MLDGGSTPGGGVGLRSDMRRRIMNRRDIPGVLFLILSALFSATPAQSQTGATDGEWRAYGGDIGATKYAALDQIDKANVADLRIAWRRPSQ